MINLLDELSTVVKQAVSTCLRVSVCVVLLAEIFNLLAQIQIQIASC